MSSFVAPKGREWLKVQPDTQRGIHTVNSAFDVDYDCPPHHIEKIAVAVAKQTIQQFEKQGWRYEEKYGLPKMLISDMPTLDEVRAYKGAMNAATQTLFKPQIHLVVRIPFVRPLVAVNLDEARENEEALGIADGYVPTKDMPEGSLVDAQHTS